MEASQSIGAGQERGLAGARPSRFYLAFVGLPSLLARATLPLARPWVAGAVALVVYLWRGTLSPNGLGHTKTNYFNYLADAFLHGQLALRFVPPYTRDLVFYADQVYLYWLPFPAVIVAPLVALFGVDVSDVVYTAVIAAGTVALIAKLLQVLDRSGVAPLDAGRRALLVATCAFGTVLLILAPVGTVWFTAQLIGLGGVLLATIVALSRRGKVAYPLVGLCLACAMATRFSLLFNGVWLAYYLWRRDYQRPRQWLTLAVWAMMPVALTVGLLGWYNAARFGNPLDLGLAWHNMGLSFRADYERYGAFNLHYLPTNLYYQFLAYRIFTPDQWKGSGLFWMTPVFLGALYGVWRGRRGALVWLLVLSCLLVYVPIGLLMGTGEFTFGPRYLLDFQVPLLVLTVLGIRRWDVRLLSVLMLASCVTYAIGSSMWLVNDFLQQR